MPFEVLAHHGVGRLLSQAAQAPTLEVERVRAGAAVLLMGEFRRTALALKSYRSAARPQPADSIG